MKLSTKDRIMLCILVILSVFGACSLQAQNGFRINKTESFTISTSIDPSASIGENGLDIVGEIEYSGSIYTKLGFEHFPAMYKGYTDIHAAIGINFTSGYFDSVRYYAGIRTACVFRDSGYGINYGLESGIDYNLTDNLFVGIRATYDYRLEQKAIFGWEPEMKFSGFLRIGYKWKFKNR